LEATETKYISLEKLILMELEINRRDLTNRVKIPFTRVRNEVGSPSIYQLNEPPRRVEATYQLPRLKKERVDIDGFPEESEKFCTLEEISFENSLLVGALKNAGYMRIRTSASNEAEMQVKASQTAISKNNVLSTH
jgi:hypothetical protein